MTYKCLLLITKIRKRFYHEGREVHEETNDGFGMEGSILEFIVVATNLTKKSLFFILIS